MGNNNFFDNEDFFDSYGDSKTTKQINSTNDFLGNILEEDLDEMLDEEDEE